jgi:hypothetical protein
VLRCPADIRSSEFRHEVLIQQTVSAFAGALGVWLFCVQYTGCDRHSGVFRTEVKFRARAWALDECGRGVR